MKRQVDYSNSRMHNKGIMASESNVRWKGEQMGVLEEPNNCVLEIQENYRILQLLSGIYR
jgi:hypothetical protein